MHLSDPPLPITPNCPPACQTRTPQPPSPHTPKPDPPDRSPSSSVTLGLDGSVRRIDADEGALVAAIGGCTVGVFGWVQSDGISVANAPPSGSTAAPDGFVHRELTAQINSFSDEASLTIPEGFPVTVFTAGDFWATSTTAATPGQAVFASTTTGSISTAAAGSTVAGAVQTRFVAASACAAGELVKLSTWSHAA